MSHLYEDCPLCKGTGRIQAGTIIGHHPPPHEIDSDGFTSCFGCKGSKVVKVGITSRQLERIVERYGWLESASASTRRRPGDLSRIDDLVDLHGDEEADDAWLRIKSDLARMELASRAGSPFYDDTIFPVGDPPR